MGRKRIGMIGLFAGTILVVLSGVLYAQQRMGDGMQGGMMGTMQSMMQSCPMMRGTAQGPEAALRNREELGLTAGQVERLEELQRGAEQRRMQSMERMRAVHEEIAAASDGERLDERALRAAYERMGEAHADMGVTMARLRQEVRGILSDEQREQLGDMAGGMGGMMQMMRNCPMMQGMMGGGEGMMGGGEGMMGEGAGMMGGMGACPMMQDGMEGMPMDESAMQLDAS